MQEIYLFISSTSKECIPVLQYINSFNLGNHINIVRLDTKEIRDRVKNHGKIKIEEVPIIFYIVDGSIQIFTAQKVMQLLISYVNQMQATARANQPPTINQPPVASQVHAPLYSGGSKRAMMSEPQIDAQQPEPQQTTTMLEEPIVEEEESPKLKKKKSKKGYRQEQLEFEGDGDQNSEKKMKELATKSLRGFSVKPSNKKSMHDLSAKAKMMEEQRRRTLGYED